MTYLSCWVSSQWVDGEVDMKVELKALCLSISVFYL